MITWTTEDANAFRDYLFNKVLNTRTLKMIEMRGRAGTGTEHLFSVGGCCGLGAEDSCHEHHKASHKYSMKKAPNDAVGEELDLLVTRSAFDDEQLAKIAEQAADVYERVLARARKENGTISLNEEEGNMVREDILRETVVRSILAKVQRDRIRSQRLDSREGGLLATPAGWKGKPLDSFTNDTLRALHDNGYGLQRHFLNSQNLAAKALDEMKILEFESFFRNADKTVNPIRADRILWLTSGSLKKEKHPSLTDVLEKLESLPFELNLKCSSFCQVPPAYQLSMFPVNSKGYDRHFDGALDGDSVDNGVKYTVMWFPVEADWDSEKHGGGVKLYNRDGEEIGNVGLETDLLLVLK